MMKLPGLLVRGLVVTLVIGLSAIGLGSPAHAASPKVGSLCSEKERGKVIQTKSMKASKSYVVCEWVNEDPHDHQHDNKEDHASGDEPYEGLQWVARGIINVPAAAGLKPSFAKKLKTSDQLYKALRRRYPLYDQLRPRLETDPCKIQGRKAGYGDTDTAGRRGFPIYEMRNDPDYDRYPRMIDDGWTPTSGDIKIFVAVNAPANAQLGKDSSTGDVTTVTYVLEESRSRMINDNGSRNLSDWPALAEFDEPVVGQLAPTGRFTRTIDVQGLNQLINKRFFDLTEQTSIASFVAEQSYGRALVSGDIGVIKQDPLEGTTTLITASNGTKPNEKEQQVAWRAFEAAKRSGVDFSQYTQLASLQLGNNDTSWNLQSWRSTYDGIDSHITLNGKRFRNAFTVSEGKDANMAANVISHEFGHATGMADTYGQQTVAMTGLGWMDVVDTGAFGWTRYIHRWLKDYEVECVPFRENDGPILAKARNQQRQGWYGNDGFSKVVKLAPLQEHLSLSDSKTRKHMIVIPLSDTYNYITYDVADVFFGGGQLSDQEIFDRQGRVRPRSEYAAMYSDDKIGTDALIIENWQPIGSSAALTTQGRSMGVRGYVINADDASSHQGWRLSSSSEKAQLAGNYEERRWITHLRDGAQYYLTDGSNRDQRRVAVDDGVLDQRGQKLQFIYSAPSMFADSGVRCDRRIQVELLDQPSGSAPDLRVKVSIDVADVTGSCEAPTTWGDPSVHSLGP
jgi:M6 family metalloprotease-like protein